MEIKGLQALTTQENCHLPCQMDDLEPNEPLSHPARHTGMYKMQQKTTGFHLKSVVLRVEVAGFEPAAFWSRTKRATKLRYTSRAVAIQNVRREWQQKEPIEGLEPSTC